MNRAPGESRACSHCRFDTPRARAPPRADITHPTALLSIKWEAFHDRVRDDPFGSHDLEDVLMLIAGRPELATELHQLPLDTRELIADSAQVLLAQPSFDDVLEGMFCVAQRLPAIFEGVGARLERLTNLDLMKSCK